MLITISGTHSSGKSTLSRELGKALSNRGKEVVSIPSLSLGLQTKMKGWGVEKYDDINALELRPLFQYGMLGELLETTNRVVQEHLKNPDCFIVVDRWLPDIIAYSQCEFPSYAGFQAWFSQMDSIARLSRARIIEARIRHIPFYLKYYPFELQKKESRATLTPQVIDEALRPWVSSCHTIDSSDLETRVSLVLQELFRENRE